MHLPDLLFLISNYTDTGMDGSIKMSSSLELKSENTYKVNSILKILIDGHIDSKEITDPNKSRKREQLWKYILAELDNMENMIGYTSDKKERVANKIIDSLVSGRGLAEPFGKHTQRSPSGKHKVEKYKLWFD